MDKRTCSIDGCDRVLRARGWCTTHWARWKKHGDPNVGARVTLAECVVEGCAHSPLAGRTGSLNPMWVGDDVGYSGVHARLRKELGPACERDCAHCGAGADDWAYDHGDPDERVSMDGLSYSVKGP